MVLSLEPPQKFYQEDSNEHVFGVTVPTETFGMASLKALQLAKPQPEDRARQKIRVITADASDMLHYSTCMPIVDKAVKEGFVDTVSIEYNPRGDEDQDGK